MKGIKKTGLGAKIYSGVLIMFTAFVLLDTFVIPRTYTAASENTASAVTSTTVSAVASKTSSTTSSENAAVTSNSYSDGNISIKISTYRQDETNIYVADITLSSAEYLKTALAKDTYGKNITETTSTIAAENNAILAINGDFYGAQNSGYVIRNGTIYRETVSDSSQEDLVIYKDGTIGIVTEGSVTAPELLVKGAEQVLSFGPGLIENGQISVTSNEEVGKAQASNPRTALGIIDDLHYVLVVSDGRTSASTGLSLYQLATFIKTLGVSTAYNLDGGGSSTMVFNGTVINNPTTNGSKISERSVSDIVYIGY